MSKRNDISQQIRKYLNGELDARAMHQLEKEAQNDPFLMEALEGYEKAAPDQQKNIDEINARLQSRINKNERRIIPWRMIAIAASVLIMLGVGGLFIKNYHTDEKSKPIALVDKVKIAPIDTAKAGLEKSKMIVENAPKLSAPKTPRTVYRPAPGEDKIVARENPPAAADMALNPPSPVTVIDTAKLADVTVVGYAAQKKATITESVSTVTGKDIAVENRLAGKVAGININKAKAVTGIVKDDTGEPLPGVTIRVKGTNIGVQTNSAGRFKLDSVPAQSTLVVGFIGYYSKDIPVNKRDTLVIAMQPAQNSLSEVVVTSYGISNQQEYQSAHPQNGWSEFKKYLKDNAKSPDGKTGTVKLSFIVNADNSLSDFKILKSVSAKTDSAAIDLVTDGPNWQRNTANKPEKIRVRIKFNGK